MNDYENAIEINGLIKKYDGFTLDNISFNVPKGSIMGFIGQNGAGKTTTIRALLNITKTDGINVTPEVSDFILKSSFFTCVLNKIKLNFCFINFAIKIHTH